MPEWETEKPMTEREHESGEEQIDESGRNPTQRQMDGDERGPADSRGAAEREREAWEETNDEPAQGEQDQDVV